MYGYFILKSKTFYFNVTIHKRKNEGTMQLFHYLTHNILRKLSDIAFLYNHVFSK